MTQFVRSSNCSNFASESVSMPNYIMAHNNNITLNHKKLQFNNAFGKYLIRSDLYKIKFSVVDFILILRSLHLSKLFFYVFISIWWWWLMTFDSKIILDIDAPKILKHLIICICMCVLYAYALYSFLT